MQYEAARSSSNGGNDIFMIRNFAVVRFSLRIGNWHVQAYGEEKNREAWFEYRAELFNAGLLRCFASQTVRPNKVWLTMDQTDVAYFNKYIDQSYAFLAPVFERPGLSATEQVKQNLTELGKGQITISRIDSDDLICDSYFEEINREIQSALDAKKDFDFVLAPNGFRTDMRLIKKMRFENGPFITLYTPNYDGQDIYKFPHGMVLEQKFTMAEGARWIQIIHGSNLKNKFSGASLLVNRSWPKGFHRPTYASLPPKFIERAVTRAKRLASKLTRRKS